jgi:hypothetical protein
MGPSLECSYWLILLGFNSGSTATTGQDPTGIDQSDCGGPEMVTLFTLSLCLVEVTPRKQKDDSEQY